MKIIERESRMLRGIAYNLMGNVRYLDRRSQNSLPLS